MKLLPCRVCERTPAPLKRANMEIVMQFHKGPWAFRTPRLKQRGRQTWFECECGIAGEHTVNGTKAARVLWNDENLEAYLHRQLIGATDGS